MKNLRIRWIGRKDTIQGHFRLVTIAWETGDYPSPAFKSNQFTIAITPRLFIWAKDNSWNDWLAGLLFLRVHRKISRGGIFP